MAKVLTKVFMNLYVIQHSEMFDEFSIALFFVGLNDYQSNRIPKVAFYVKIDALVTMLQKQGFVCREK